MEQINDVSILWKAYREQVYDDELPVFQNRELSLAFYAGIEATFKMIDIVTSHNDLSERDCARMLAIFRDETARVARLANLDRQSGMKN